MRVAVVGAGAAGLWAATQLERAGLDVALFEARNRLGGRLTTYLEGGTVFEAGGEWIDADHERTVQICRSFGFEPEATPCWPGKVWYQGEWSSEDLLWPDALEDELRFDAAAIELCRDLDTTPWKNPDEAKLDQTSLAEFIRSKVNSPRGRWWLNNKYRSDEGENLDRISLLGWLCNYKYYAQRDSDAMSAFRVPGGFSKLLEAIAAELRGPVYLGKELRRVDGFEDEVVLHFDDGVVKADRVILTLPPRLLEKIAFTPAHSPGKRCAIEACEMGRIVKIAMRFRSRWWDEIGWNGRMHCEGPLQQVWDGTRGESAILMAYVCGDDAEFWLRQADPSQAACDELSRFFPQATAEYVEGWISDWVRDDFAGGAFSYVGVGYALTHLRYLAIPENSVHYAGEHTAIRSGFIEGAFESADRAVSEILNERTL